MKKIVKKLEEGHDLEYVLIEKSAPWAIGAMLIQVFAAVYLGLSSLEGAYNFAILMAGSLVTGILVSQVYMGLGKMIFLGTLTNKKEEVLALVERNKESKDLEIEYDRNKEAFLVKYFGACGEEMKNVISSKREDPNYFRLLLDENSEQHKELKSKLPRWSLKL